ncbi:hypothetical protein OAI00_04600 [Euryarchaeota archaeon]|nr:hypothetical protein [Euryarchaeota archaeon]
MSGEEVWLDDANKENIETLRERFNILESSTYASPRITMKNDSVSMIAERALPLFFGFIPVAFGIIPFFFIAASGASIASSEGLFLTSLAVVLMLFFGGTGIFMIRNHYRGDKWLFIHETHLELRHENSEKGILKEFKHILSSDIVKIISENYVTESTDEDGRNLTSVYYVTSILVYDPYEPESRTNQELCLDLNIHSSSIKESDAISVALNFLILGIPLPSSTE